MSNQPNPEELTPSLGMRPPPTLTRPRLPYNAENKFRALEDSTSQESPQESKRERVNFTPRGLNMPADPDSGIHQFLRPSLFAKTKRHGKSAVNLNSIAQPTIRDRKQSDSLSSSQSSEEKPPVIDSTEIGLHRMDLKSPERAESVSAVDKSLEFDSDNSEDLVEGKDPLKQVYQKMEEFYDKTFSATEFLVSEAASQERVWKVQFDKQRDLAYLFLAKFDCPSNKKSRQLSQLRIGSATRRQSGQEQEYRFSLTLQVIDLNSKAEERICFKTTILSASLPYEGLLKSMQMSYNKYHYFAQLAQFQNKVYVPLENNRILVYDSMANSSVTYQAMQTELRDSELISFSIALFHTNLGFLNQKAEQLFQFSLYSSKSASPFDVSSNGTPSSPMGGIRQRRQRDSRLQQFSPLDSDLIHSFGQKLREDYRMKIGFKKYPLAKVDEGSDYAQRMYSRSTSKLKEQWLILEDARLREYYQEETQQVAPIFVQRLKDSAQYLLLFPTGLLVCVSTSTFSFISKTQLYLGSQDRIIDVSYCVNSSMKNQCIWILDSRMQVWKCRNDLSRNSWNWSLRKIQVLESEQFRRFFHPGMTYEDFVDTSVLSQMEAMKSVMKKSSLIMEYLFCFNKSATQGVIVKQPMISYYLDEEEHESQNGSSQKLLTPDQFTTAFSQTAAVKIFLAGRKQPRILTQLKQSSHFTSYKPDKRLSAEARQFKYDILRQFQQDLKSNRIAALDKQDDENFSKILFIGEFFSNADVETTFKFILVKKRKLEVLSTHKRSFEIKVLNGSEVNSPLFITGVQYFRDCGVLLISYSSGNQAQNKQFKAVKSFQIGDQFGTLLPLADPAHIRLDSSQRRHQAGIITRHLKEISIQIKDNIDSPTVIENTFSLIVQIPSALFDIDRLKDSRGSRPVLSPDARIIVWGKLILSLDPDHDEIRDCGCLVAIRENTRTIYEFLSFMNLSKSIIVSKLSQGDVLQPSSKKTVFHFEKGRQWLYLPYNIDSSSRGSAILRLDTEALECSQIFVTRHKVIAMKAIVNNKDQVEGCSRVTLALVSAPTAWRICIDLVLDQIQTKVATSEQVHHSNDTNASLLLRFDTSIDSDVKVEEKEPNDGILKKMKRSMTFMLQSAHSRLTPSNFCLLAYSVNILSRQQKEGTIDCQLVSPTRLFLTFGTSFWWVNFKQSDLSYIKKQVSIGVQQIKADLFCQIARKKDEAFSRSKSLLASSSQSIEIKDEPTQEFTSRAADDLQACMSKMELASFKKFAILKRVKHQPEVIQRLLFFTPCEELSGGNVFSRVAGILSAIKEPIEVIDSDFIDQMNLKTLNIANLINPEFGRFCNLRIQLKEPEEEDELKPKTGFSQIHMYDTDMNGLNPIDYAFQKNAIFCIKAFVQSLLHMPQEQTLFRNCIDKALLLMINKGMDVKDLVNSQIFFPSLWTNCKYFSPNKETNVIHFNGDLHDLDQLHPSDLFEEDWDDAQEEQQPSTQKTSVEKDELHEMEFKYILMEEIEGRDKLDVCRSLADCEDIDLFSQEAIQHVIDYKWDTYARFFFLAKFYLYLVFLIVYYIEVDSVSSVGPDGMRIKNFWFYAGKAIGFLIQGLFFSYELLQMSIDRCDYFTDPWNYLELAGNFFYAVGSILDMNQPEVSDLARIIISTSVIFTLAKVVYLVRVFKQLNFLVTMFITVVKEIIYFMILFCIFLLTFAESFHVLQVDISLYGRTPAILAYCVSVLRCAMGDFSIISISMGFDIIDDPLAETEDEKYRFSREIMLFTYFIFLICCFFMFMIFMNFIIAVISESYLKVIKNKEAFDYQQRAAMITERETYFSAKELQDPLLFPKIIIVRKFKQTNEEGKAEDQTNTLKAIIKQDNSRNLEVLLQKQSEQQNTLSNQIKVVEKQMAALSKEASLALMTKPPDDLDSSKTPLSTFKNYNFRIASKTDNPRYFSPKDGGGGQKRSVSNFNLSLLRVQTEEEKQSLSSLSIQSSTKNELSLEKLAPIQIFGAPRKKERGDPSKELSAATIEMLMARVSDLLDQKLDSLEAKRTPKLSNNLQQDIKDCLARSKTTFEQMQTQSEKTRRMIAKIKASIESIKNTPLPAHPEQATEFVKKHTKQIKARTRLTDQNPQPILPIPPKSANSVESRRSMKDNFMSAKAPEVKKKQVGKILAINRKEGGTSTVREEKYRADRKQQGRIQSKIRTKQKTGKYFQDDQLNQIMLDLDLEATQQQT